MMLSKYFSAPAPPNIPPPGKCPLSMIGVNKSPFCEFNVCSDVLLGTLDAVMELAHDRLFSELYGLGDAESIIRDSEGFLCGKVACASSTVTIPQ